MLLDDGGDTAAPEGGGGGGGMVFGGGGCIRDRVEGITFTCHFKSPTAAINDRDTTFIVIYTTTVV